MDNQTHIDGKTFYEILGVAEDATPGQIRAAYRSLMQRFHPDRYQPRSVAEQRTKEFTQAFRHVGKAHARQRYDGLLAAMRRSQHETDEAQTRTEEEPNGPTQAHTEEAASFAGQPTPPPHASAPVDSGGGGGSWIWWAILVALAVKWFGPLQALVCVPVIAFAWRWGRPHGLLTRLTVTGGAFAVATVIAWTISAGATSALRGSLPQTVAPQLSSATATPPSDEFDPVAQEVAQPLPAPVVSQGIIDPVLWNRPVQGMAMEDWRQVRDAYFDRQHAATASDAFVRAYGNSLNRLYAQYPNITAGELLTTASRVVASEIASAQALSAPPAPLAQAHARPAPRSSRPPWDAGTRPSPILSSNHPDFERLPADEQLRILESESNARVTAFEAQRYAGSGSYGPPEDAAKSVRSQSSLPDVASMAAQNAPTTEAAGEAR